MRTRAAAWRAVWKSATSCHRATRPRDNIVDGVESPRHRADTATEARRADGVGVESHAIAQTLRRERRVDGAHARNLTTQVARICKRTMPCLRPRNDCPTCKEVGYDIKNDPLGVLCCVGWFAVCAASLAYLIYWIVMRAT